VQSDQIRHDNTRGAECFYRVSHAHIPRGRIPIVPTISEIPPTSMLDPGVRVSEKFFSLRLGDSCWNIITRTTARSIAYTCVILSVYLAYFVGLTQSYCLTLITNNHKNNVNHSIKEWESSKPESLPRLVRSSPCTRYDKQQPNYARWSDGLQVICPKGHLSEM